MLQICRSTYYILKINSHYFCIKTQHHVLNIKVSVFIRAKREKNSKNKRFKNLKIFDSVILK